MSQTAFRRIPAERQADFQRVADYAFDAAAGPRSYDDSESTPDLLGTQFGLYADETLRTVCTHYDFTVSLRGEWVSMAGLASLATRPEYRREGHVSDLISASLERWRGDAPFAALWPFDYGYYEQFGWAMGCTLTEYTCPPAALAFARDAPGGLCRLDADDWEQLQGVVESYGMEYDLTTRRDESWWRRRIFDDGDRYVYGLERGGQYRGYLGYTVEDGPRMNVLYSAFTDRDAFRGLLGFLSDHDSQVETVTLYRPAASSLLDMAPDPKAIDCERHPGTMVRVVSVVDALETVAYPEGVSGTLRLAVTDETAPWNDGTFELTVSEGTGSCRRVDGVTPDLRLDAGTLAQLAVGYHTAPEARKLAGLDADDEVTARLARWFPSRTVAPMDNF
ncbi:Predicted acetyltransferase [Halovenus aranensis]|uniref:Predicted acetyltransferase n=1 Tax=Halovenus aranensis TaxID=890420 RepID=A0A1G8WLC2_9EURY|nr:GNAT family N-acetyltransferase [Halovenus aranensis]SDJ79149.1 Predicted acetyltransferase [Halovenus aranensis]